MTDMECPKCGKPMEYESDDPDVGILNRGWVCAECDVFVEDDDDGSDWL